MAYIFGTKYYSPMDNRASALTTARGLLITSSQNVMNCGPQMASSLQIGPSFLPIGAYVYTYVNSVFCFIQRLRRRRSANGTQPSFAKRWTVNRANNPPYRSRARPFQKPLYICSVLRRFRGLMANIFWTEHDIANWSKALPRTKGLIHRLKISWTCPQTA